MVPDRADLLQPFLPKAKYFLKQDTLVSSETQKLFVVLTVVFW